MRRFVPLLLALTLSGCATVRQRDIGTYAALAAADAVSTYAALDRGLEEVNPLLTLAGEDAAQVALSSAAVSFLVGYWLDHLHKHRGHDHRAWRAMNLVRAFGVAWNLSQIAREEP